MLRENFFTNTNDELAATREGFGKALVYLGEKDKKVTAICADLTESVMMKEFREKFGSRFVEVGIQEQNMAALASGMASMGMTPFIASYAMFSPGRNWEQIRTTIAYNNQKVIIAGAHAGLSVGPDGGTHQALEDIALMRVMPNMTILSPADSREAELITKLAREIDGPVYIRLAREKTPTIFNENYKKINIKKLEPLFVSKELHARKVCIMATGPILAEVLLAASELDKKGVQVCVLNVNCVKPLAEDSVLRFANTYKNIVTVEEHQIIGGLGSAVAELVSEQANHVKLKRIGIENRFGQSGTASDLYQEYGLDKNSIIQKCLEIF